MANPEPIKIRATWQADNKTAVKILLTHEMETGQRKDVQGKIIPAFFIQNIRVAYQEKTVLNAQLGPGISQNPFLEFRFQGGQKGGKISVTWSDNRGGQKTQEAVIEEKTP